jgi:penicillin amidase
MNWGGLRGTVPLLPAGHRLQDFGRSVSMHTTGQSGHAFSPHYDDMIDSWRLIQYHPMLWDRATVEAASKGHLVLRP